MPTAAGPLVDSQDIKQTALKPKAEINASLKKVGDNCLFKEADTSY